jgi:hypothetical protein
MYAITKLYLFFATYSYAHRCTKPQPSAARRISVNSGRLYIIVSLVSKLLSKVTVPSTFLFGSNVVDLDGLL